MKLPPNYLTFNMLNIYRQTLIRDC